ncbi:hypothetical protein ACFL4N_04090 [Thermodesulfobacteriota bacterium]
MVKICLLFMVLMSFMADGDRLSKDTIDTKRTNIRSKTGDLKGWIKKDTLDQGRINVYDKYGNQKGYLKRDTLNPDNWQYRGK